MQRVMDREIGEYVILWGMRRDIRIRSESL